MSVKFQDNSPMVVIDIQRAASLSLRFMLEDIDQTANPKTPKDKGFLRNDIRKQVLGLTGEIVWQKRYAKPQEEGIVRGHKVRNYTTPGTGAHFAENAVREVVKRADTHFRKARLI